MPAFKVAHVREQGQDMLLFPLDGSFHHKTPAQQSAAVAELESRAHEAGLAGRAAVFWEYGGRGFFRGPTPWRAFLQSISLGWVMRQVNREIQWS